MSCSGRMHQFPRNLLRWQVPGCIFQIYVLAEYKQLSFKSSLIIEGATEKVSHFKMSICIKNVCFNEQKCLFGDCIKAKFNIKQPLKFYFWNWSFYLFRAATCEHHNTQHNDILHNDTQHYKI